MSYGITPKRSVSFTVFPLINAPRRILNFETARWGVRCLLEDGAYFKVREINNIKCQKLFIFRMKQISTIFSLFYCFHTTTMDKIFETSSGFRVKYDIPGKF